ncbi:hypothetical protein FNF29_06734 [Cafeteria roenbergensis]|uniref:ERCC4 domain-containing protein n=1 Tax=Cafeteria roenbergensis TaxID=33653 RepID=A0A5A8C6P0_CAFRO|nr:hypothetical protein FNF29_06734 [Cafeteria roenbergensis]KAA0163232.1 hypothetical protein FNF28_04382 [Cafeteria roenbergensis]|eukprot:KAA0148347.1 hypothetical protein FNF29_06734 [Cafeteria roenbergensis]
MAGAATGVGETDAIGAAWGQAVAAASSAFGGDASDSDAASLPRITDALTAEEALKVPTTGQGLFRRIFTEVLAEDGLLVVARGMGLRLLLERFIRVFCGGRSLVAVLGCSHDSDTIRASLSEAGVSEDHLPVAITNEMSAAARVSAYQRGGPVIVTSRILVIDLLTRRLPAEAVAGMLVAGAHRLTEASSEAFCLRLFRDANPSGFVKGFSDDPGRLASGFNRLESSLKLLGVRQLHLWPRFHALAQAGLTAPRRSPEVVDLSVPLTPCVLALQRCLVTALDGCLRDLQSSPAAELDGIDLGRAAQEGFEVKLRRRLDPVWHRLSAQARQVVADVGVIRRLLAEVARLDAVSLYALLLSLRQAHRHQATDSLWIMSDAAEELYRLAKDRVFVVERAAQRQSDEAELSVAEPDDVALLGTAGEWERRVFGQLRPQFVVLLEPSASFVREVEVYSALAEPPFPGAPRLRVYSTRFANSVEQSHFTASLADEEDAFRKLIQEKSNMAVPRRASAAVERAAEARTASTRGLDAWGISTEDTRFSRTFGTLSAGGASASKLGRASAGALGGVKDAGRRRVVVDIREFRSALPSLLHAAGMEVVPVTIDVGDYVIAPRVCLERKSVPDLVASLASGRLYTQCVAMTRHYDLAVLLVEFDGDRPFGFGSAAPAGGNDDGRLVYDIQTKLCILAIHFPSLRILWARSPHAAVDMILAIKQLHPEPDPRLALAAGTEDFERVKAELQAEAAAEASGGTTALATRSAQSSAALGAAATAGAVATSAQDAARDVLRRIPGVTEGNVGTIMRTVYSVAELSSLSLGQLGAFLDHRTAAKIFDFLHGKVPPGGV